MATIHKLFNELVDKRKITVRSDTQTEHDNLRTRLCKFYTKHKSMLTDLGVDDGDSSLSLSGDWNSTSKTSTFHIRQRRNRIAAGQKDYEIVIEADN